MIELTAQGTAPLSVANAKTWMKVTSTSDDTIIQGLINAATVDGEKYTGRSFRAQTWKLYLDDFCDRITLPRCPVDAITSVKYTVSGSLVTVDSSTYYLKKGQWNSEILLVYGQDWPTDSDIVEQGIEIVFTTAAYSYAAEQIDMGLKLYVAYLYENRGDCTGPKARRDSGAEEFFNLLRIERV
jgi:uncharacterized phiE125 gp8 family phage protein